VSSEISLPYDIKTSPQLDDYIKQLRLEFNRRQYIRTHPSAREEIRRRMERNIYIYRNGEPPPEVE